MILYLLEFLCFISFSLYLLERHSNNYLSLLKATNAAILASILGRPKENNFKCIINMLIAIYKWIWFHICFSPDICKVIRRVGRVYLLNIFNAHIVLVVLIAVSSQNQSLVNFQWLIKFDSAMPHE